MSSYPLKRDPTGADAASTRSSPITRRSRLAPRRRLRMGLPEGCGLGAAFAALSIPDGFSFGRGGRPFSRAISSLRAAFSARRTATSSCSRTTCASRLSTSDRRSPIANLLISSRSGSDMNRVNHTTRHVQRTFCTACPGFCPGYVVPPNAWLDLPLGPFIGADIYELNGDVFMVWRLPDGRFFRVIVAAPTGRILHAEPAIADREIARRAAGVIGLVSAAVVRDFWVLEERRRVFDVRGPRVGRAPGSASTGRPRIVYLPRYRYFASASGLVNLSEGLSQVACTRHYVRPHFRRVENPSLIQLEQARSLGLDPPLGCTFISGHYRGDQDRERIYRSRSALTLVTGHKFEVVEESSDDWFAFERNIARLLTRLGYIVLRKAARGHGDEGIDILATRKEGAEEEIWIIQCKAYAPNRPVSVAKVRELLGALADFSHQYNAKARGLLVST